MSFEVELTIEGLIDTGTATALQEVRQLIGRRGEPALPWPTYRDLGKRVSQLDAADASRTAWELFQQALRRAEAAGEPRHTIRTQMADMLLRESKFRLAMQTYLQAYVEAPEPRPAYLRENVSRCFEQVERAAGVTLERFLELAESEDPSGVEGINTAMRYLLAGVDPSTRTSRRATFSTRFLWWLFSAAVFGAHLLDF